jgi:hypothetical protein
MLVLQVFIFKDGAFLGTEMCTGERIEIGRDPNCEVVLEDENVSRRHAMLFEHQGRLAIQDAGSAVGTHINGQPVTTPRYLGPRDDVVIGRYTLKFKQQASAAAVASSPDFLAPAPTVHASDLDQRPTVADLRARAGDSLPSIPLDASDEDATIVDPRGARGASASGPLPVAFGPGASTTPLQDRVSREAPFDPFASPSFEAQPEASTPLQPSVQASFGSGATPRAESAFPSVSSTWPPNGSSSPTPVAPLGAVVDLAEPAVVADAPTRVRAPAMPTTLASDDARGQNVAAPSAPVDGAEGVPHPSVDLVASAGFFDDDDDDAEPAPPPWSLVHALVRSQPEAPDAAQTRVVVEVIHYRGEAVLDHVELKEGESYDFGAKFTKDWRRDRGISRRLGLVVHKRKQVAEIQVTENLQGKLLREGQQADLRSLPEAQGKNGKIRLTEGDFASLDLLGDKVFVRFARMPVIAPSPEQALAEKESRRTFLSSTGSALGAWLLIGIVAWIAQYRGLQERVIQLEDDGFAEIIEEVKEIEIPEPEEPAEPELPPEEPKPQDAPKVEEKPPTPSPTPPTPVADAPKKPGVLDALKNLPAAKPAGAQSLNAALSNIKGVHVPGASGFKVSEMTGKGVSGVQIGGASGGVDTNSLNSILRKGGGTGALAAGEQRDVKGRVKTLTRESKLKGQGVLSKEEIQAVIQKHIGEIQYCYEKQLRSTPGLAGKVVLEWTIGTDGRVKVVKSSNSSLKSAEAINCMSTKVKTWVFPTPRGAGSVIVTYPFIFNTL